MSLAVSSDIDLFGDEVLAEPYPHYETLRRIGPVVYLERYDLFALPRYAVVKAVLRDWERFTSAQGIMFNPAAKAAQSGSLTTSDPPEHDHLRSLILRWLSPKRVRSFQREIEAKANNVVASLVERGAFDAVTELAEALPSMVVGDLVGLPKELRVHLLEWGEAGFNAGGPINDRTIAGVEINDRMIGLLGEISKDDFEPGSIGYELLENVERGELAHDDAVRLLISLTGPSIDTTVSGIATSIHQLALHPDQWALVRKDPSLIPAVGNEAVRYESPLQTLSRVVTEDWQIDDVTVPKGSRLAILYGSANRDERKYVDPDRFDIMRDANDQLAFGFGIHRCVGAPIALLQIHAALVAITSQVTHLDVGEPSRRLNNTTRRLSHLPATVIVS